MMNAVTVVKTSMAAALAASLLTIACEWTLVTLAWGTVRRRGRCLPRRRKVAAGRARHVGLYLLIIKTATTPPFVICLAPQAGSSAWKKLLITVDVESGGFEWCPQAQAITMVVQCTAIHAPIYRVWLPADSASCSVTSSLVELALIDRVVITATRNLRTCDSSRVVKFVSGLGAQERRPWAR